MTKLSILDLVQVNENSTIAQAIKDTVTFAQKAEQLGFTRFWVAEHHNTEAIASAATSVVISHIAAHTKSIRIGAGGIMLPNHSPLVIAEQFGTLEHLYPGRIDLGLGRAPGTDQMTVRALRRNIESSSRFPQDVVELKEYLYDQDPTGVRAIPGMNTKVPLWILGSSLFGAQLAAHLGLPYAFASHFSPQAMMEALSIYKAQFKPSAELEKPYAMIGVNVICAKTDEEARFLFTSKQQSFADLRRGRLRHFKAPIENIDRYWSPDEKLMAQEMLAVSVIGSPSTVRSGLESLIKKTGADELMIVSGVYDINKRLESLELISECAQGL